MILKDKSFSLSDVPKVLYENRYCNQKGLSFLACGGQDANGLLTNQVLEVKIPSFEVAEFPTMAKPHSYLRVAAISSKMFAIVNSVDVCGKLGNCFTSVEVYSEITKSWRYKYINVKEQLYYCLCSFMNKLYIIGGQDFRYKSIRSCNTYDISSATWNKVTYLNEARNRAACTVFEGKIVITGGQDYHRLKSVESYDHYENKWTFLPDMIETRHSHAAVSMGNKMFVIGGYKTTSCEVFDSFSGNFTEIKSGLKVCDVKDSWYFDAFCIGHYIVVLHSFSRYSETIINLYDACENKWSTIECDFAKNLFGSSYVKYYA